MTTIVYRDGIMAADSRAYTGSRTPIGTKTKIRHLEDGTLVGVSSSIPGGGEAVLDWYLNGKPESVDLPGSFTLLVVTANGQAFFARDTAFVSGPIDAPYFAIGSGEEYALGALSMGASAVDAVRAGVKHDVWSGFPILALAHEGDRRLFAN